MSLSSASTVPGGSLANASSVGAKTVNGQSLKIAVKNGNVMIDNAKVVKADIATTNGVIHVIDTVVLPPQ